MCRVDCLPFELAHLLALFIMTALFSLHCLLLALHTPPHVRFITPKYHVQRAALLASEDAADAASTKSSSNH